MIGNGPQNGFRVKARNILTIRAIAKAVSKLLGIGTNIRSLNIANFLDDLSANRGITYDVLESDEMPPGVLAYCLPDQYEICIRTDVYDRACDGIPRDIFTIIHELGHLILGHRRTINREDQNTPLKTIQDSEWQANQFAAETLMPYQVIKDLNLTTASELQREFNVSAQAAQVRLDQLRRRGEII